MQIQLLGGFAVVRDGLPVEAREWRLRKARTLVKLLALAPDQRLHRDVLLETLWPDRDPASAINNLHQVLHVARRVLAGDGSGTGLVELRDDVVVLNADVDVQRFQELADEARAGGGLADLRTAVAAYTGDLLPEDRFEDWAVRRRAELRETLCDLLVEVAAKSPEAESLAALQRVLTVDPLHERAVRGLMRQLTAAGRRSESLARYERLRDDLRDAYGTDPDPETRRLYRSLLTADQQLYRDPLTADRDTAPADRRRDNLAPALTSFVGRVREIAEVRRLLDRGGLITLTGVGGAGKTRLAEETAHRLRSAYADGVWLVELSRVGDPGLVADTVAAALGLDPSAGTHPLPTLVARLAPQTLLLVLDNCEHLLSACTELATAIRRGCPGVTLLATSREPLHVPGEVTFRVPSLELPEPADAGDLARLATLASVRLFLERARDVRPGFVLDAGSAASVVEICRRLDGIPLALELAAARMSHLEAVEVAERLGEALSLLGRRSQITRHATLRAAIEWSHDLLGDDERILLRRLAVFAGSFTLPAAEQVGADDRLPTGEILDCLGRLADKSLVQTERAGDRTRYRLLETIRQLAREQLVGAGEAGRFEAAHCRHFLRLAQDHDPDRTSGVVVERPQLLDADHDNLRAALGWAMRHDHDRALALGVSLWRYWLARGHFVEGAGWLERILAVPSAPSPEQARAYFALAVLEARRGLSGRLAVLGDAGVAASVGSPADLAYARLMRGTLQLGVAELDDAERMALAVLAESAPPTPVTAAAGWLAALVALFREDVGLARQRFAGCLEQLSRISPAEAPFFPAVSGCLPLVPVGRLTLPVFEESWLLGRRVGAVQGHAYALSALGYVHRFAGDLDNAREVVAQAADAFAKVDDTAGLAHALNQLGCVERDARRFDAAGEHLDAALRLREQLGDHRGVSLSRSNLGLLCAAAGDFTEARRHAHAALDRGDAVDDGPGVAGALLNLAVVEVFAGDRQQARDFAERAVTAFEPQGYLRLQAWSHLLAAELADRDGQETHGHAAIALFRPIGCRIGLAQAQRLLSGAKPLRRPPS